MLDFITQSSLYKDTSAQINVGWGQLPSMAQKKLPPALILTAGAGLAGTFVFSAVGTATVAAATFAIIATGVAFLSAYGTQPCSLLTFVRHLDDVGQKALCIGLISTLYFGWAGLQFSLLLGIPYSLTIFFIGHS